MEEKADITISDEKDDGYFPSIMDIYKKRVQELIVLEKKIGKRVLWNNVTQLAVGIAGGLSFMAILKGRVPFALTFVVMIITQLVIMRLVSDFLKMKRDRRINVRIVKAKMTLIFKMDRYEQLIKQDLKQIMSLADKISSGEVKI